MDPFDFDQLWNYGNPERTEQQFRALIPAAQAHPDPEYYPQLLTQIARTFSLRRKFDEAHAVLDQAETLLQEHTPIAWIRYLLERGRSFNSAGDKSQALTLFSQAWEQANAVGAAFYAVDAAHMAAIAEQGNSAMEWNLKAIGIAENSSDPRAHGWLGSLYNNTGWDYHDKGDFTKALDLFQDAGDGVQQAFHAGFGSKGKELDVLIRKHQKSLGADADAGPSASGVTGTFMVLAAGPPAPAGKTGAYADHRYDHLFTMGDGVAHDKHRFRKHAQAVGQAVQEFVNHVFLLCHEIPSLWFGIMM